MATTTGLMTVEQYRELPEAGPFYSELRQASLSKWLDRRGGTHRFKDGFAGYWSCA